MSRAEDLFSRLETQGLRALDQLIADAEPESPFLDFKRADRDGANTRLAESDRRNLSKAISGFANSEGGILIWGIDCRRDTQGREVPTRQPLANAAAFRSRLENAVSGEGMPPLSSVRMLHLAVEGSEAGYVVTLIPRSEIGPIRSIRTNHYHIRVGTDFVIVPHDVLAGMFGRSPQPRVSLNFVSHPARLSERKDHLVLALRIVAVNIGAVLAERGYLTIWYGQFPVQAFHPTACSADYSMTRGILPGVSFIGKDGTLLAPGGAVDLCDLLLQVPRGYDHVVELKCVLGARDAAPTHFKITVTPRQIADALQRLDAIAPHGQLQTSDFLTFDPPID